MRDFTSNEDDLRNASLPGVAWPALIGVSGAIVVLHIVTNSLYDFHRDEWQFLSDASHLDWGFVAYPPLTPFIEHVSLGIFGLSLVGLRLCSVLFQAAAIVLTGLTARELGGKRFAQFAAALAIALSPLPLFEGTEFQYSSFDYLWWTLIAFFVIRLLRTENPRWWLAIGATIGLGLLTKYSIVFYIAGVVAGIVLSRARRYLLSGWFWAGVALAWGIFLPNFLWQVHHQFISYHFLHSIHVRDVGEGRANGFFVDQIKLCANFFATPMWIAGLVAFFMSARYRMLAWMYVVPLALFVAAKGRGYYLAAAYPMLMAMGAVVAARWVSRLPRWRRNTVAGVFFIGLAACGALFIVILVPLQTRGPLRDFALKINGDLREEFGWRELVQTVASIRDSLTPAQQASVGIIVGNYGEQGAIEMLGPAYHLPPPISMTNSAWLRGYPTPQPATLIVVGFSREKADRTFAACRLAGHNGNPEGIQNEESQYHPEIFVCGAPLLPWPEFWRRNKSFG